MGLTIGIVAQVPHDQELRFPQAARVGYSRPVPTSCHGTAAVYPPDGGSTAVTLPDLACTPGAVDTAVREDVMAATICVRGYAASMRPPDGDLVGLVDAMRIAYWYPAGAPVGLDHLVPLSLGGANDIANLWPQEPEDRAAKDEVEAALQAAVCTRRVGLADAQAAIVANWVTALDVLRLDGLEIPAEFSGDSGPADGSAETPR